jgi:hypothetical protein
MKKNKSKFLSTTLLISIIFSSCSQRIGDLTLISNRNVEFQKKHIELKRGVIGKSAKLRLFGFTFGKPNIEEALDNAIMKQGTGEYLKNATVSIYWHWFLIYGTKGIKIQGDLMGYEDQKTLEQIKKEALKQEQVDQDKKAKELSDKFNVGDKVSWKNIAQQIVKGEIIGKDILKATIMQDNGKNAVIVYSKLIKIK